MPPRFFFVSWETFKDSIRSVFKTSLKFASDKSTRESAWELSYSATRFISIAYVLTEYGINMTTCVGPSMIPTMKPDGDMVAFIDNYNIFIIT